MKKVNCILLVDDNPADNEFHKIIINDSKVCNNVKIATSGSKALEYIIKSGTEGDTDFPKPDLIFLDINMPGMNGFEFLEEYQSFTTAKSELPIPIIIMFTSSDEEIDKNRATKFPIVRDYLVKPLTFEKALKLADIYGTPTE